MSKEKLETEVPMEDPSVLQEDKQSYNYDRKPSKRKGLKWIGISFIALVILTGIYYLIVKQELPTGWELRRWVVDIFFVLIPMWQVWILALAIYVGFFVFGKVDYAPAKYIGEVLLWGACVAAVLYLAANWLAAAYFSDSEHYNSNGTITVSHVQFLDPTTYSLWKPEGLIYRSYIRACVEPEDIDPDGTYEGYMKEHYPHIPVEDLPDIFAETAEDWAYYEEQYVDGQRISDETNDGLVAIYQEIAKRDASCSFSTSWSSGGEAEAILYEDDRKVRYIRFDRMSVNEACYLYVYYEAEKAEDGSYSPMDAKILDMYAYEPVAGKVILSGKKAWTDVATQEYRDATGE